ncbi:Acetyltransferase (GNAT) family protein [Halorientalis persicus]|uniref:Acetyltransferase (GNAT) family protein n=1 Tax=Halorientalis persicus TaxID=1367881 RepID=A0A1H8UG30_9EURY|nr:GNAT family N-acetyltransferase [Halorientalis persicus]SEP02202.1 Acetyltransferase (GNAT) family protein [Halorientalis persicus]
MNVERPDTDAADAIADLWVDLAEEQRDVGSHLRAAENRDTIGENVRRAIVADGLYVAVAEPDDEFDAEPGAVLGFVMFSAGSELLATTSTRGTIENLYVRPEYRDRGIGGELIGVAEEKLAVRGVDAVKLEVLAANEAARRFYRRQGYDPHRVQLEKSVESDNHSKG